MSVTTVNDAFAARFEQLRQGRATAAESAAQVLTDISKPQIIEVKPMAKDWEELRAIIEPLVNMPGFIDSRVKRLFDAGFGAELETAAEIAQATFKKSAISLFTSMISIKSGYWETRTLPMVKETWERRQNALKVMEDLKLDPKSKNFVLHLSWKLKGAIIRALGMATEQGYGIKNPAGYFFGIIKRLSAATP